MTVPHVPGPGRPLAVLTGVARKGQVGEVVARVLGAEGMRLALLDREGDEAHARAAELRALGIEAAAYACDLTDLDALGTVAERLGAGAPGGLAALVCLAGGYGTARVADGDLAAWPRMAAINLTTAQLTTRAFLPLLRSGRGAIVYFAAAAVLPGERAGGMAPYVAAKAGVVALMRAVAQEEREHGVRANALAPTAIRTAANLASMKEGMRYVEREEVAAWVRHLVSSASSPLSGEVIRLG